jgi:hypothetical protein
LEQAKREVAQFVATVESHLQDSGVFLFPGLGTMKMEGKRGEITFIHSSDCDLAPEGFGLTPLSVKPLSSPSRLLESRIKRTNTRIRRPKKRVPKWLYALLGTFLVIIIALLLVYLFRAELRPWLMKLFYTPEQIEQLVGR